MGGKSRLLAGLGAVLLLIVLGVAFLVGTDRGSRFATKWAFGRLTLPPGQRLEYDTVHGRLLEGLLLVNVRWSRDGTLLASADTLLFAWRTRELLSSPRRIRLARAAGLRADIDELRALADEEPADERLPAESGPTGGLDLVIDRVLVERGRLLMPRAERELSLHAEGRLDADALFLESIALASERSRIGGTFELPLHRLQPDTTRATRLTLTGAPLDLADLELLAPGLVASGDVRFEAALSGRNAGSLAGSWSLAADSARVAGVALAGLDLGGRFTAGRADSLRLAGRVAGIRLDLSGEADPFAPEPGFVLRGLVDLPGEPGMRRVDGTLRATFGAERWTARLETGEFSWDRRRLPPARLDLVLDQGRHLRVDGEVAASNGRIVIESLAADLDTLPAAFRLERLRLERVSPELFGMTEPGSISGDLTLSGVARAPADSTDSWGAALSHLEWWTADGTLRLDDGRVGQWTWRTLEGRLGWEEGRASVHGFVDAAAGRIDLRADVVPGGAAPAWRVHDLRFLDLDLSAALAENSVAAAESAGAWPRLTGRFRGEGRGFDPRTLRAGGRLTLDPLTWRGRTLDGADLEGRLDAGHLTAGGTVTAGGAASRLDLLADPFDPALPFSGSGRLDLAMLPELLAQPALRSGGRIDLELSGSGRTAETLQLSGSAAGAGTLSHADRPGTLVVDTLATAFRWHGGRLDLDSLLALSPVFRLAGSGALITPAAGAAGGGGVSAAADTAHLLLDLVAGDLRPLAPLFGLDTLSVSAGRARIDLFSSPGARSLAADGALAFLEAGEFGIDDARFVVAAPLDSAFRPVDGTARLSAAGLRQGDRRALSATLRLRQSGRPVDVEAAFQVTERTRADLAGRLDPWSETKTFDLSRLDLDLVATDWALARPARLTFAPRSVRVDDLELRSDTGRMSANGGLDRDGPQDLVLEFDDMVVSGELLGIARAGWAGRLTGRIAVTGPADGAELAADLSGVLRRGDAEPATFLAKVTPGDRGFVIDGRVEQSDESPLTLAGRLPYRLQLADAGQPLLVPQGDGALDLRLRGEAVSLDVLSHFLDARDLRLEGGRLDADLAINGTLEAPRTEGTLSARADRLALPGLGVEYRAATLAGRFDGPLFRVETLSAESGKGRLTGSGELAVGADAGRGFHVDLKLDRFEAAATRDLRATLTGELKVAARHDSLDITGSLRPNELTWFFTPADVGADTASVTLTTEDERMMRRNFVLEGGRRAGISELFRTMSLDLDMVLARNAWYRQRGEPRITVELAGQLRVTKRAGGELLLNGRLEPVPGRGSVDYLGRLFDIQEGEIRLDGELSTMRLDMSAEYRTSEYGSAGEPVTVTLDVDGTLERLSLTFSSDPALTTSEILALVARGGMATRTEPGQEDPNAATNQLVEVGLGRLTGAMEELAQRNTGLDVLQIRQDGLTGATLVAGTYVSPRLYVGIRQPVTFEDNPAETSTTSQRSAVELEYSALKWLLLALEGEGSRVSTFLRGRHAF